MRSTRHSWFAVALLTFGSLSLASSSPLAPLHEAPAIGDLVGRWEISQTFTGSELTTETKFKEKEEQIVEVSLPGGNELQFRDVVTQEIFRGRYVNGFVLVGQATQPADGSSVSIASQAYVIQVSGTPGKLKGKGTGVEYDISEDFAAVAKVKFTQLPSKP